jgi:hypothetical protein
MTGPLDANSARLDRIEIKLDKLADALTTLVRVEERLAAITAQQVANEARVQGLADRIELLQGENHRNAPVLQLWERTFWLFLAGAISAVTFILTGR